MKMILTVLFVLSCQTGFSATPPDDEGFLAAVIQSSEFKAEKAKVWGALTGIEVSHVSGDLKTFSFSYSDGDAPCFIQASVQNLSEDHFRVTQLVSSCAKNL